MLRHGHFMTARFLVLLGIWCVTMDCSAEQLDARITAGQKIYQQSCVDCHGSTGQGTEDAYEQPLAGDASLAELSQLIASTMPEGDEASCVGEDAEAVALYLHRTLYPQNNAKVSERPVPRLARLTAEQLRQSLADLYRRQDGPLSFTAERGLKARYFNRKSEDGKQQIDRVDSVVDFDFGHSGPGQGINKENFSIRWTGAIKPDESGRYEIIVRSPNSFILYLGDYKREFINNYVQSGERVEFRRAINLQAGGIYPIAIEFNQRKRKTKQPPAKISLSWKTPRDVEQIIPARAMVNTYAPPAFSLQTRLPADDRSYGYERGIAVDQQWNEATTAAAIEFANQVADEAWPRYRKKKNRKNPKTDRSHLRQFLNDYVASAFRGPLRESQRQRYIERQLAATESDREAIKRVLLLTLKSPRFLYPTIDSQHPRSYRAANRLALTLFDSLPVDKWLRVAAEQGKLETESQIRDATWRMMGDWRVRAKTKSMLHGWLNLEHGGTLSKSPALFPDFNAKMESDLRASLDQFLDDVIWDEQSDYRQLFLANWTYATPDMAGFYGPDFQLADRNQSFGRTQVAESPVLFGVLTHPLLMSGLAYHDATSPIHRGVFLIRFALGRTLRPPNEAFTPFSPHLHPNLTTRERTELQTGETSCQVCHAKINGLGFTLENYDAVGRYQTLQREREIDASGSYTTQSGEVVSFASPRELAEFLANSEDAHRAFVRRTFQFFVKQPPAAFGADLEDRLLASFREHSLNVQHLIVEIAAIVATATTEPVDKTSPVDSSEIARNQ